MKKEGLSYYLKLNYPVTITKGTEEEQVYYEAEIPDLPGCNAHGSNIDEALKNVEEAKRLWLKASLDRNLAIPEPATEDEFSGKFLLRIPAKLHMELTILAKKEGISLNQYVRKELETRLGFEIFLKKFEQIFKKVEELDDKVEIIRIQTRELSQVTSNETTEFNDLSFPLISSTSNPSFNPEEGFLNIYASGGIGRIDSEELKK